MSQPVKVAYCECGEHIQMAAVMPFAETDKGCQKDFAKYAKMGRKIAYIESSEARLKFGCTCKKEEKQLQSTLF
jgi:hypothetical protein